MADPAGAVLEVVPTNPCTEFLLKGYVRQDMAWRQNSTDVKVTIAAGALQDCQGRDFPGVEASAYTQNGSALMLFSICFCSAFHSLLRPFRSQLDQVSRST